MKIKPLFAAAAVIALAAAATTPVNAKSLIRGSFGKFLHKNVNPVATPLLQTGTAVGMTAVGAYYGGPAGAAIGARTGSGINNMAAGRPF